jgi:hypothetical protein
MEISVPAGITWAAASAGSRKRQARMMASYLFGAVQSWPGLAFRRQPEPTYLH